MAAARRRLTDADILQIVKAERANSLGEGDELSEDRARAYDYLFGKADEGFLRADLPPDDGQSAAVSSDISDAVETLLPDLIEIFTAGDDVIEFRPRGSEDEAQAAQETDYVNYVFFEENPGWMILYENFKDALISKTGIFKWWWDECEEWDEFVFEDKTPEEWALLKREFLKGDVEIADVDEDDVAPDPQTGLYTVRARRRTVYGKARVATVAPEDFRIDRNATSIRNATWCANRSRMRAFELIEQGFDAEKVATLRDFDSSSVQNEDRRARRFENDDQADNPTAHDHDILRRVEIWEYHIWLDEDGDGKVECWKLITGNEDSVLLDKEQIAGIQFSANCPYPITHRFYGRSLGDLLVEVQKIKTALYRIMLNAYYHGVNPRPYVNMTQANRFTLADLLKNKPGFPIRVDGDGAVNWRTPAITGDVVLPAIEFMSTVAEGRTGVVRNAQGLNPDTLHDTARGAMELMSAAQRRIRMIARIFAETGVADLFRGLHDLIVRHGRKKATVRLRNQWVEVDPNKWARRKDLKIDVGIGSNTRTADMAFWGNYLTILQNAAGAGVAISPAHLFNSVKMFLRAGNVKHPEMYFPAPEEQERAGGEPQNPDVVKAQGELALKQQELQSKMQLERQKFQFEAQLALYKTQLEAGLAEQAAATEARLEAIAMERKFEIESFKARSDAQVKTMSAAIGAKSKADAANARFADVRFGGAIG